MNRRGRDGEGQGKEDKEISSTNPAREQVPGYSPVYQIVLARPIPKVDLLRCLGGKLFGSKAVRAFATSFDTSILVRIAQLSSLMVALSLLFAGTFGGAESDGIVTLIAALLFIVCGGFVISFLLSWDMILLIITESYEFWFFSTMNFIFALVFAQVSLLEQKTFISSNQDGSPSQISNSSETGFTSRRVSVYAAALSQEGVLLFDALPIAASTTLLAYALIGVMCTAYYMSVGVLSAINRLPDTRDVALKNPFSNRQFQSSAILTNLSLTMCFMYVKTIMRVARSLAARWRQRKRELKRAIRKSVKESHRKKIDNKQSEGSTLGASALPYLSEDDSEDEDLCRSLIFCTTYRCRLELREVESRNILVYPHRRRSKNHPRLSVFSHHPGTSEFLTRTALEHLCDRCQWEEEEYGDCLVREESEVREIPEKPQQGTEAPRSSPSMGDVGKRGSLAVKTALAPSTLLTQPGSSLNSMIVQPIWNQGYDFEALCEHNTVRSRVESSEVFRTLTADVSPFWRMIILNLASSMFVSGAAYLLPVLYAWYSCCGYVTERTRKGKTRNEGPQGVRRKSSRVAAALDTISETERNPRPASIVLARPLPLATASDASPIISPPNPSSSSLQWSENKEEQDKAPLQSQRKAPKKLGKVERGPGRPNLPPKARSLPFVSNAAPPVPLNKNAWAEFKAITLLLLATGTSFIGLMYNNLLFGAVGFGIAGSFFTWYLSLCNIRLFRWIISTFDFLFHSCQSSLLLITMWIIVDWDVRMLPLASLWMILHLVIFHDALLPCTKQRYGLTKRFAFVATLCLTFMELWLLFCFCVLFNKDVTEEDDSRLSSWTSFLKFTRPTTKYVLRNPTYVIPLRLLSSSQGADMELRIQVYDFAFSRLGTLMIMTVRLIWRTTFSARQEFVLLQGRVEYDAQALFAGSSTALRLADGTRGARRKSSGGSSAPSPVAPLNHFTDLSPKREEESAQTEEEKQTKAIPGASSHRRVSALSTEKSNRTLTEGIPPATALLETQESRSLETSSVNSNVTADSTATSVRTSGGPGEGGLPLAFDAPQDPSASRVNFVSSSRTSEAIEEKLVDATLGHFPNDVCSSKKGEEKAFANTEDKAISRTRRKGSSISTTNTKATKRKRKKTGNSRKTASTQSFSSINSLKRLASPRKTELTLPPVIVPPTSLLPGSSPNGASPTTPGAAPA